MSACYEQNLNRLKGIAESNGLILNPDQQRVEKVVGLMATNYEITEEWICPCKQTVKPAEKGKDIVCPCPEWQDEIEDLGHCHCKLFYAKDKG